jgi:hypothetical protein
MTAALRVSMFGLQDLPLPCQVCNAGHVEARDEGQTSNHEQWDAWKHTKAEQSCVEGMSGWFR